MIINPATERLNTGNNFNFLRLLFSSLVILGHSFVLTGSKDPLGQISDSQTDLGTLSVKCFFVISGYLVFTSLRTSPTWLNYLWKRMLRIFPALVIMLLLSMLVLPFFYEGKSIFQEMSYRSYFPNCLSLFNVQYEVEGVFTTNKLPNVVNGSLWTLCYEFSLYLLLLLLFPFRHYKHLFLLLVAIVVASYFMYFNHAHLFRRYFAIYKLTTLRFYRFSTFFFMGCVFSMIELRWWNRWYVKIILIGLLLLSVPLHLYKRTEAVFLAPLVLTAAVAYTPFLSRMTKKLGDISYGVYIYGFPVQQGLLYFFDMGPLSLFLSSLSISYLLGYFSWVVVESRAQKFKDRLA